MNYGVVLPIWQLSVAEAESLTVRAESLGLDGVFVPDHILAKPATTQHYGGHWPDPFSLLAFLAGRTQRIRLGASVIVLLSERLGSRRRRPRSIKRRTGFSSARSGVGRAEFADLRLPFRERGRLSDDYLRAIKAAWAADVPEYKGEYVSFSGATFAPRPMQRPNPPIWVGGSPGGISSPAVRRCAELGDAWHPSGSASMTSTRVCALATWREADDLRPACPAPVATDVQRAVAAPRSRLGNEVAPISAAMVRSARAG